MSSFLKKVVRWLNGRKPLGLAILRFRHKGKYFYVVERPSGELIVASENGLMEDL